MSKPGPRRRSVIDTSYRVRLVPIPVMIDEQGKLVADAFVVSIRFPREMSSTLAGHVPVVIGAGVASILVGRTTVRGVPLC